MPGMMRFSAPLVKGSIVGFLALSSLGLRAQQDGSDRPHLSHRTSPIVQSDPSIDPPETQSAADAPGTPIGDGLVLPDVGHVWVRDSLDGRPHLVQLKYVSTQVDTHAASNMVKANMAPFIYKPKDTIEIHGAAANVRLHDPEPTIYLRGYGIWISEDAADSADTSTQMDLTLAKVESKKDHRIVSTIAFTQITGKAARNNQTIAINIEKLGNTDWQKITPKEPLPPGEYVLMGMPRGANLFPARVFDFAIDPQAPASETTSTPAAATPSR